MASSSLLPAPSVVETRTGSGKRSASRAKRPAKPPISLRTCLLKVRRARPLMRSLARTWRSVETMAWSSLRGARVSLWVAEDFESGDEAAEPSRGDCSSLPEIDFAKEAAFT